MAAYDPKVMQGIAPTVKEQDEAMTKDGANKKDPEAPPRRSACKRCCQLVCRVALRRIDVIGVVLTVGLTVLIVALLSGNQFKNAKGDAVPFWEVGFVFSLTVAMVILMTFDVPTYPSEVVLIGGAAIFRLFGIIPASSVLAGLSDTTVTSVALLFPMAKAISDTGFLEVFVGTVLGTPGSHFSAILRLCLLVGPLSAFFNNTPVTAMMVPVVKNWCSRLGFDVAKLGMPLAFAAQLGGSLTLMGSPTNFAARKIYMESNYNLGFFELTIVAAPLFAIGTLWVSIMSPLLLGKRSKAVAEPFVLTRQFSGDIVDGRFRVSFIINNTGPFSWGKIKVPDAGFDRLEGVFGVKVVVRDDLEVWGDGLEGSEDVCLKAGDVVVFRASAEGIAELRRTTGLRLTTSSESHKLGHGRRKRLLFEVELPPTSTLLGAPVSSDRLREEYGCALMAVRARKESAPRPDHSQVNARVPNERVEVEDLHDMPVTQSSRWSNRSVFSEESSIILDVPSMKMLVPDTTAVTTFDGFILNDGDVMLLESNPKRVGSPVWVRDFGIVRAIGQSTPPKLGRKRDTARSIGALTGALLAIGLFAASSQVSSMDKFSLTNNLILLVLFLLATGTLTVEDVYDSMNGRVLLTMVGAFPLGEAIQAVGLDSWAGTSLVNAFAPLGTIGSYIAIYVVCAGLSNLISNIAVIAMVAPVSIQIAQMQGLSLRSMVICTTLATSAVFTFPIGHQTNLMVLPLGNYSWGDFLKLGGSLQLVHGIACCLISMSLA